MSDFIFLECRYMNIVHVCSLSNIPLFSAVKAQSKYMPHRQVQLDRIRH